MLNRPTGGPNAELAIAVDARLNDIYILYRANPFEKRSVTPRIAEIGIARTVLPRAILIGLQVRR